MSVVTFREKKKKKSHVFDICIFFFIMCETYNYIDAHTIRGTIHILDT